MTIEVPRAALVVLIGPSASGKSTFARRHFAPTEIVSSDALRAILTDDENEQRATPAAFELLHRIVAGRMAWRRTTAVDATNVERRARRSLLELARARRAPALAIVFDVPVELCLERNELRADRRLRPASIERQHALLRRSLSGLPGEGFGVVHHLRSAKAVEAVEVVRRTR